MAFGKKKKEPARKNTARPAGNTANRSNNPLYPPKKESQAAEVLVALGTSAACLLLVGVIFTRFSYSVQGYPSSSSSYTQTTTQEGTPSAELSQEENTYEGMGTGTAIADDEVPPEVTENQEDVQPAEEAVVTAAPTEAPTETPTATPPPTATPTATPTPTPEERRGDGPDDYVIPDSTSRYLTEADLEGLTKEQLLHARNEIYARHGRLFQSDELQAYFNGKSWYHGTIAPSEFDANASRYFNDYEAKNSVFILEYEKKKGYM